MNLRMEGWLKMNRIVIALPVAVLLAAVGCQEQQSGGYPKGQFQQRDFMASPKVGEGITPLKIPAEVDGKTQEIAYQGSAAEKQVQKALEGNFSPPWFWQDNPYVLSKSSQSLLRGELLYRQHCVQCHGVAGDGQGIAAQWLDPKPRDYRKGVFKWKSTVLNAKPTKNDLAETIRNGTYGASMPSFRLLNNEQINDVVEYVVYLSMRGEFERTLIFALMNGDEYDTQKELDRVRSLWNQANNAIVQPALSAPAYEVDSDDYKAAVIRGRDLFLGENTGCYKCHGKDGKADPSQMAQAEKDKMFDDWGHQNFPRNLNYGLYRGGRHPLDLYRRVHQGIRGTAMPGQGDNPKVKPEMIWDIVLFLKQLPRQPELLKPAGQK